MRIQSIATEGFDNYRYRTSEDIFLKEMDRVVPWDEMTRAIESYYLNPKEAGRRPVDLEFMPRLYFLRHWFELSDFGVEEMLYNSLTMRACVEIDLKKAAVPDETTMQKNIDWLFNRMAAAEVWQFRLN